MNSKFGKVVWLTGISGAGKTTLGTWLAEEISDSVQLEFLDGNQIRDFFGNDLGFSDEDRIANVRRIVFAADLLSRNGINVVIANIAPFYEARNFIREKLEERYIQIYIKASKEVVIERDVWGHYKRHQEGTETQLVGFDQGYDVPRNPDLVIDSDKEAVTDSCHNIINLLIQKGMLNGKQCSTLYK